MGRRRTKDLHLPPRLYRRHGAYWYSVAGAWRRLSSDLGEALRIWADLEGNPPGPPAGTMDALIARYLEECTPGKSAETQRKERDQARLLSAFFGRMVPTDVRPMHVAQYLDRRRATPVAANREKALLSHIFTQAMGWGVVDANPCRGVRRHPERPRQRYVEDTEFSAVRMMADESVRTAMDLSYLTAQRVGDVLRMGPRDIEGEVLRVVQGKTGVRLAITLTGALRAVIERARSDGKVLAMTWVHRRDGRRYTYAGFSTMWQRTMKRAARDGVPPFTFHDIRAKALTDLERAGVPRPEIQALAGHKSAAMTEAYIKAREVVAARALDRRVGG